MIIIHPVPPDMYAKIPPAVSSILELKFRREKTWKYTLLTKQSGDTIYFWRTTMRPLVGKPFPPTLEKLHTALHETCPIFEHLLECLTALYDRPNSKLNFHVDIGGIEFWEIPEYIVLLFSGFPRHLKFRPNLDHMPPPLRSLDLVPRLVVSFKCDEQIMIHITPLANILFKHSKSKCASNDPSVTLAFRRGVPLHAARSLYPHLKNFKV